MAALRCEFNLGGETVDTKSATGKLILAIFPGFAQFEREMMLERQREGIAKAQAEGRVQRSAEVGLVAGLGSPPDGRRRHNRDRGRPRRSGSLGQASTGARGCVAERM